MALFLLPTGQANLRIVTEVNGLLLTAPSSSIIATIAEAPLAQARPGSSLDITGDVIAFGGGSPMRVLLSGKAALPDTPLADGAVITIAHGNNLLERIVRKDESVPFKTVNKGTGAFVRLARAGVPGQQAVYHGVLSHKQAAVVTTAEARDAVLQHSSAAKQGEKLAALTFDDGPGRWTQGVLDALAAKKVPATFFMLGSSAAASNALVRKVRAAGHEVENHSWSHPTMTELTPDAMRKEISRTDAAIGGGHFFRPPYGTYDTMVTSVANSLGYDLILWTVDTLDWKYPRVDSILSYVKAETKPGAIILMHDGGMDRSQTVAAIPKMVDWLLQQGYSLTTVEHIR